MSIQYLNQLISENLPMNSPTQENSSDNEVSDEKIVALYQSSLEKLLFAAVNEQRARRRWRTFFIIVGILYLTFFIIVGAGAKINLAGDDDVHIARVAVEGVIIDGSTASAANVIKGMSAAVKNKPEAIVLEINSPGGSPVQAAYIYETIAEFKADHPDIPIYAVVTDVAASGGYFVAAAADTILVNKSSLVGSIGVRMDNFGAVDLIKRLGVERRLLTAGEHKGLLDPFLPVDDVEKAHVEAMLSEVHQHFIDAVKRGRGQKLSNEKGIFSGLIWSGEKAVTLGLADGFGSLRSIRKELGVDLVRDYTVKEVLLDKLAGKIGSSLRGSLNAIFGVCLEQLPQLR